MKSSRYNIVIREDKGVVVFNTLSGSMAQFAEEEYENISNPDAATTDLLEMLSDNGFIVDDCINERAYLEYQFKKTQFSSSSLSVTIAPTLSCNYKCPYCYESSRDGFLNEEGYRAIAAFIEDEIRERRFTKLQINWYGGEPLLAFSQIRNWSERFIEICAREKVDYCAHIITNGSLLTEEIISEFAKCKITNAQITLDGWGDLHDKRRPAKNGMKFFEQTLANITRLSEAGIEVSIRMNVDKINIRDYDAIADYFSENPRVNVHVGHLLEYETLPDSFSCFTCEEFAQEELDIFLRTGYTHDDLDQIFQNRFVFCGACSENSYVIDEQCNVYKCWNDIGNDDAIIFNLKEPSETRIVNYAALLRYMDWNPLRDKLCSECVWLPICGGGCVFESQRMKRRFCYPPTYVGMKYLELYLKEVTGNEDFEEGHKA